MPVPSEQDPAGDHARAGGAASGSGGQVAQPIGIGSAIACLLIVIVRGGNPVAIKVVLESMSPMQGAFARVAIGCAGVGVFAAAQGGQLKPARTELAPLALLSVIYAFQIGANQTGTDLTSPVLAAILLNTYPIIANLVSSLVVPEDRLGPLRITGLAIAFAGVAWILMSRSESVLASDPLLGNALVMGGSTLLALRVVYLRQLVLRINYAKAVFWPLLGSLPLFLVGDALLSDESTRGAAGPETWLALLYQGIVVGGVGQLAWVYLIRRHTPGRVTAFSFLTPVSGVALSSLYFREPVPPTLLAAFVAVLAGIALAVRRAGSSQPRPPSPPRGFGGSA